MLVNDFNGVKETRECEEGLMPMDIFGIPLQTIYLYGLIISAILTFMYLLFGDVIEGVFEGINFINPILLFSFFTIFTASGYLLELLTSLHSLLGASISAFISLIVVSLMNIFIVIPLSKAEESLVYEESDLKGRVGTVITTIPVDGFGEILIESFSGRIAKSAVSFDHDEIPQGSKVLIIDVVNGVVHVSTHEDLEQNQLEG